MKTHFLTISLFFLVLLSGCASQSNSLLQSKVDTLEARTKEQDQEIANLKKQNEPTTTETKVEDTAKNAWNWTTNEFSEAYNSAPSVEARARLEKCWNDLKNTANQDNKK